MTARETKPAGPSDKNKPTPGAKVQGEGDYDAARDYDRDVKAFVKREGPDIERLARKAADALTSEEAAELAAAEKAGRAKAKDEDPAVKQR